MAVPNPSGNNAAPVLSKGKASAHRDIVEAELIASVAWLINLRWVAGIGVIVASWAVREVFRLSAPTGVLAAIGTGIISYNLIFFLLEKHYRKILASAASYTRMTMWQTALDWGAMTLLIRYSGGIESPAILFFIFHIIIASIFFPRKTAYIFSVMAVLLVSGTALLEYFNFLPHIAVDGYLVTPLYRNSWFVTGMLFFFSSTGVISAYLVSTIHERLGRREQEIMELSVSLRRATERLQALNEGARTVGSTLELQQVLDRLVKSTAEVMGVRACSIRLLDASGRMLERMAVYGLSQAYLNKGPVDAETNPLARETLSGKVVNIPDVPESNLLQYPEEARAEGIQSMLSAPLCGKSGTLGIIRAYARERARFIEEDETFLTAIAAQGSIAIENALAYQAIAELEAMKSQFIRTVTHELRSPVSVSRSLLRTIEAGYAGGLNTQQSDILSRASRRLEFLQSLIDDLLDMAASKALNKSPKSKEAVDLPAALDEVIKRYQIPALEKEIHLEWRNYAQESWVQILATPDGIDRIFNNLISNAVKYTPNGGTVIVELNRLDDEAQVSVVDTGIGIPEASIHHLFEEFYRAPNAKEFEQEGTGLGLVIVKDLVTHFGGRIVVHSKENEGTRFTVFLPCLE